jgi:S1-C subfamily serine protease
LLFRELKSQFPSFALVLLLVAATTAGAQQSKRAPEPGQAPAPAAPAPPPQRAATAPADPARPLPPTQIVTVLHRLSGIKLMKWLHRSGAPVAAIVEFDNENATTTDMHMSITAGLAVGDGQNIVASLPRAEVEASAATIVAPLEKLTEMAITPSSQAADMTIVRPDGSQLTASYVGLDGLTGLSLLRIDGLKLPLVPDALEEKLAVGQRVRLYAPEPAGRSDARSQNSLYLRMGEIEGRLAAITRSPSGRVAHLTVRASNLSPSINGGIAINDAGETVGIIEGSSAGEARILPAQVVRRAAERVLARRSSVPRPLLGVRGRAVTSASLLQFKTGGWSQAEALALMSKGQGLLLTSVVPNTPAALADLRPGDIILSVNDSDIKSAEDFSFMLSEAGDESTVLFKILRGQDLAPLATFKWPDMPALPVVPPPVPTTAMPAMPAIKLDPFDLPRPLKPLKQIAVPVKLNFSFKFSVSSEDFPSHFTLPVMPHADPFFARGMETIPLAAAAATRRGARSGVLVISVSAASQAESAGLREGDVVETVNGRLLTPATRPETSFAPNANLSLGIVRRGQRLSINLPAREPKRK